MLSFSGHYMALVEGLAFFIERAVLALFPALALRYVIKNGRRWRLSSPRPSIRSGAEVATQRSYIMNARLMSNSWFQCIISIKSVQIVRRLYALGNLWRDVEVASEAEAIAKGAEEFKQPKERLMAVRRG